MNQRKYGRILSLVVCATLLLTFAWGCQTKSDSQTNGGSTEGDQSSQGGHEPLTILTGNQKYQNFEELLKQKYPEVQLEFISFSGGDTSNYMRRSLEAGDIPDIYAISYVPDEMLQKEHLLDLASYSVVNEYADTMLDSLEVEGGIYLLPSRFSLLGIVYNKTLMEENGWTVPNSFEELKVLAPEIQEAGYEVMNMKTYLTGTTFGTFFALGNTNYFRTPEGSKWKTDFLKGDAKAVGSLEEVADYFQEWIDAGFIDTYYYDNTDAKADADFDARKAVFQIYSNRMEGEDTTDEYGFMPFLSKDGSNNMMVRLVSRYYGLSKELEEEGNEQKLEDALKVFEVMATKEGQDALSGGSNSFISSTAINDLPEGSPYEDVLPLINSGNMVDMVYSGWEDYIVPLIENYGNEWIRGNMTAEGFLEGMDTLNQSILAGAFTEILGSANENINVEDTAKLCAIAEAKATNADVALVTMPEFHGFAEGNNLENRYGVHCGIFQGEISKESLNMFVSRSSSISTVKMTGAQIQQLVETGFMIEGDTTPFEYYMVTKDNMELAADQEYTVAVGSEELSQSDLLEQAEDSGVSVLDSVAAYITELGTVAPDTIVW